MTRRLRHLRAAVRQALRGTRIRAWFLREFGDITNRRPFWVSWYSCRSFTYHGPWWVSGWSAIGNTVCAAVRACNEHHAKQIIQLAHDDPNVELEWRFVVEKPSSWSPFVTGFRSQHGRCGPKYRSER